MTVQQCKPDVSKDLQSLIDKIQHLIDSPEYAKIENHYYTVCYRLSEALDAANRAVDDLAR